MCLKIASKNGQSDFLKTFEENKRWAERHKERIKQFFSPPGDVHFPAPTFNSPPTGLFLIRSWRSVADLGELIRGPFLDDLWVLIEGEIGKGAICTPVTEIKIENTNWNLKNNVDVKSLQF